MFRFILVTSNYTFVDKQFISASELCIKLDNIVHVNLVSAWHSQGSQINN